MTIRHVFEIGLDKTTLVRVDRLLDILSGIQQEDADALLKNLKAKEERLRNLASDSPPT